MRDTGVVSQPAVVETVVIWTDADGRVVSDDDESAVGGEIVETFKDGTSKSTVFRLGDDGQTPFDVD